VRTGRDNAAGSDPFICNVCSFTSKSAARQCGLGDHEGISGSVPLRSIRCTATINVGKFSRWLMRSAAPRQLTPETTLSIPPPPSGPRWPLSLRTVHAVKSERENAIEVRRASAPAGTVEAAHPCRSRRRRRKTSTRYWHRTRLSRSGVRSFESACGGSVRQPNGPRIRRAR
jgi:hypothetical protein